ncbi:cobalamin biosynthesis protein [Pandoraea faecigallinarum]|uniref:cobalamin biosynthesis protein n=1 Tax=Pandoraea faecigallinarum TaxID=656179 RepID=UPI003001D002
MRAALGSRTLAEVGAVATLDRKAADPALVRFCEHHGLALIGCAPADIETCLDAHPQLPRSNTVYQHTGVHAVCEPCALLAASGGTLLAARHIGDGLSVAIATKAPMESRHDEDR